MSWEDLLHQKKEFNEQDLKALMFEIIESSNEETLEQFCLEYKALILKNFHSWKNVPIHLRSNHNDVSQYANGLILIANIFESQGDSTLLDILEDKNNSNNPLLNWENIFEKADNCKSSGEYSQAITILEKLAVDMNNSKGSAVINYLPMVHGALGENYFRSGQYELAYDITHLALQECQKSGDSEGFISYGGNLCEICNKLNKFTEARNWIIIATNVMIQVGQIQEAVQLRELYEITPTTELITLD